MKFCGLNSFLFSSAIVILLVLSLLSEINGANILFFLGITNYSHRLSMWPMVQKLVELNHNITFFSSHPPGALKNDKVIEFVPKSMQRFHKKLISDKLLDIRMAGEYKEIWHNLPPFALEAYEMLIEDEEFIQWYENPGNSYDLVFVDALYADFAMGLAYKYKAQMALFSTTAPYMWQEDAIGAPREASWLPDMEVHYPDGNQMSFFQRVGNNLRPLYWDLVRRWYYLPATEKLLREGLGLKEMPNLVEIERNMSLVLTNTHFTEEYARSLPPNVVSIGGMHCERYKTKLPKDLEDFMNGSGNTGFIYASLGSGAKLSTMPIHLRNIFFNVIKQTKTKFVLKWEGEVPSDMPKNAFPAPWLPQQSVLAHPNIKGFITHGGLLGIHEAICDAVPTIILPVFGEQDYNANRLHQRKLGIKLEWKDLTENQLAQAISDLLTDPSYKENMKKLSTLFLDRPHKPLDLAVWWTEYILRHGHVETLKPLGIYQSWYKRRSLDVWFFIYTLITLPFWILILCLCRNRNSSGNLKTDSSQKINKSSKKRN